MKARLNNGLYWLFLNEKSEAYPVQITGTHIKYPDDTWETLSELYQEFPKFALVGPILPPRRILRKD